MVHPYREPHELPPARRPFPIPYVAALALATLIGSLVFVHHRYAKPHCAVTDCETGKIVDDGCVNGTCLACTNACRPFD